MAAADRTQVKSNNFNPRSSTFPLHLSLSPARWWEYVLFDVPISACYITPAPKHGCEKYVLGIEPFAHPLTRRLVHALI